VGSGSVTHYPSVHRRWPRHGSHSSGIADDAERLALAGADPTHAMVDDEAISAARRRRRSPITRDRCTRLSHRNASVTAGLKLAPDRRPNGDRMIRNVVTIHVLSIKEPSSIPSIKYSLQCVPIASASEADCASEVTGKRPDGGGSTRTVVVLCSSIVLLPSADKTKANLLPANPWCFRLVLEGRPTPRTLSGERRSHRATR
jgi:hypothetical protein